MAIFFENYDLGLFQEDKEAMLGLWQLCLQKGKPIAGYSGHYINYHLGDAQMCIRLLKEESKWSAIGIDTHSAGRSVWNVRIFSTLKCTDADVLEKRCVVKRAEDGDGLAVINIVNAEVLPSYAEGDEMKLQMIAASTDFHYYASEKEYDASLCKDEHGKIWGIAEGTIFPSGFLNNHTLNGDDKETNDVADQYVLLRAKVKALYHGVIQLGEEKHDRFIRCIVDTQFGELEFVHTYDQVFKEERKNIAVGATLSGVFILSGDAAINEYENGLVRDHENHLKLLRYTIAGGDPQRLRAVLIQDAVYQADTIHKAYRGADQIIERFAFVQKETGSTYFAQLATIVATDETDTSMFPVGTRCVVLSHNEPESYESLAFIDMDANGYIDHILTSDDSRYRFRTDAKPKERERAFDIPTSSAVPMVNRAFYLGLVNEEGIDREELLESFEESSLFQNIAKEKAEMLCALFDEDFKPALKTAFGELFSKTLREELTTITPIISLVPDDAYDTGTLFCNDFCFVHREYAPKQKIWKDDLILALTAVQVIAVQYAEDISRKNGDTGGLQQK